MFRIGARASAAIVTVLTAALVISSPPAYASPSATPTSTAKVDCLTRDPQTGACQVNGVVYAITQVGGTTYIGGSFTSVGGVARQNVAAIRADGTLDPNWNPTANGIVYALAASSDGSKVFIGGAFTTVGGQARGRLAAVTPDTGAVLAGWTTTAKNNTVRALEADAGDRLYVGGNFGGIGGRAVTRLAALSQTTGAVDPAFAPQPNNTVRGLALSQDATKVYTVGSFTAVGGQSRPGAAELSSAGSVTSFAPTEGGVAISVDVTPSGRMFFGTTSNRTYAYDPATNTPQYRVRTGGDVQAILATNDEVYIGGHFTTLPEAKLNRLHIASFLPADGKPTAWNPGVNGPYGVWAFGLTQTPLSPTAAPALSVGGDFTVAGGVSRRGYARFKFA